MRTECLSLLISSVIGVAGVAAQTAPSVTVRLEPASATVGDLVTATLEVRSDSTAAPSLPAWSERWGEVEIAAAGPVERDGAVTRQTLSLRAFRPGRLSLPPVPIRIDSPNGPTELRTPDDLVLEVRSVLPAAAPGGAAIDPQPPAPPRSLPVGRAFWWSLAAGGTLCLAALALLVWRQRSRRLEAAAAPAAAPLAELEAALAAVAGEPLDPAHVLLSAALRRYLGRRFSFPAPESTTSEIRAALAARPEAGRAWSAGGGTRLLQVVDEVKFARRPATRAELEERAAQALALGRALEATAAPAPPPEERVA